MGRRLPTWLLTAALLSTPAYGQYITDVPYYHQLYNSINPTGSCQNTTIAITLGYYGVQIHPDELSGQYGTEKAKTVSGWEEIFNAQARRFGLAVRDSSLDNATLSDVHRRLDRGLPVPVHGGFTASGHLIVLLGYDDTWYYVHDPNGDWSRNYQLDTPTAGRYARYPRDGVERAILDPLNAYIRMHALHFDAGPVHAQWLDAPADTVVTGNAVRLRGSLRATGSPPMTVTADLRGLGGDVAPLSEGDDGVWLLDTELAIAVAAGRHTVPVTVRAGDDSFELRHRVDVMPQQSASIFADRRSSSWTEAFVHNATIAEQADTVFAGSTALSLSAQSFIYELQPAEPLDFTGYGSLRFAFHPGNATGGRVPAFSVLVNDDPRALVKLIEGDVPGVGVDLDRPEWQVVDIPLTAFSWLEQPLTSLRFFGSLRGTFYLDDIQLVADRPFPFRVEWIQSPADSVHMQQNLDLNLAVRLHGEDAANARLMVDLSDLGGPAAAPLHLESDGAHRTRAGFVVDRPSNGRAVVRVDIAYDRGDQRWRTGVERPIVVAPIADAPLYDDALDPAWRLQTVTSVTIDDAHDQVVFDGDRAMAWDASNLIAIYQTDSPIDPVGFSSLRLHVHPGTARPGRFGAFSVMFNEASRTVFHLFDGGFDLDLDQWQQIDVPLHDRRLEGAPIRSVRILGDLQGTFYVDDVRFVATDISEPQTAVTVQSAAVPDAFGLDDAFPNPFNSSVIVPFRLDRSARVDLSIYNVLGQRVAQLDGGWRLAGVYRAVWDGRTTAGVDAASGVYTVRLRTAGQQQSTRILLLR